MNSKYTYSKGMLRRIAKKYHVVDRCIPGSKPPCRKSPPHKKPNEQTWIYAIAKVFCMAITGKGIETQEITNFLYGDSDITNPSSIVDYKADFDKALNAIGRGKWDGIFPAKPEEKREEYIKYFKKYRNFGQLQRVVIAQMLHIRDHKLLAFGIKDAWKYRYEAFRAMANYLNGEKIW